jgi:hypothetical protein
LQRVVGTLVEAHGDDIAAMARDIKRNSLQHTVGVRARAPVLGVRRVLTPPCPDAACVGRCVPRESRRRAARVSRAQEAAIAGWFHFMNTNKLQSSPAASCVVRSKRCRVDRHAKEAALAR